MAKIQAPKGLIRMASLHELNDAKKSNMSSFLHRVIRPRVVVYGVLLCLVIAATVAAFVNRKEVRMDVIRDRSVMARQVDRGAVDLLAEERLHRLVEARELRPLDGRVHRKRVDERQRQLPEEELAEERAACPFGLTRLLGDLP